MLTLVNRLLPAAPDETSHAVAGRDTGEPVAPVLTRATDRAARRNNEL